MAANLSFDAGSIEARLTLDRTPFSASLKTARSEALRFATTNFEAALGADSGKLTAAIEAAKRQLSQFAGETYEANIGVKGTVESLGELKAVDSEADRLDGRTATVDVDADTSHLRSISESFKSLASNIRSVSTVLAASSIPFGIAAIGAGVPAVAALTASIGGLATALGSGLIGAAVAATAALGALGGAFGLVAAPVALLIGHLKDYDDSLDAVKSAEDTARAAAQSRSAALDAVSRAQANVASTARQARQAVADQEEALRQTRADAASGIAAAEQRLAEARRTGTTAVREAEASLAQTRSDAARSIAEGERQLEQTRLSAATSNAQAEGELEDARDALQESTASLVSAQRELNSALQQEPLNQAQATLDLASARDRASDAARALNEAIAEHGRGSEEATDAARDLQQAQLDLKRTELEVAETRRRGSDELNAAREAAQNATREQQSQAEAVKKAEQGVVDTRAEGVRQIQEQQRALREARGEAARQVSEQERSLTQARSDRIQGEREAAAEIVEVRRDAAQEIREQEQALAETSREGAQRVAEAQAQVTEAQRAAATASKEAADAQKNLRQETIKLTPAQKALFDEYQRFRKLADKAFRPAENATARLGVSILGLAENYLPELGRASQATIAALTRSFTTFRSELSRPVEQAGVTRFLEVIPAVTEQAATAAGHLGLALFNVFTRSLKYAVPFVRTLREAAGEFLGFTESASGMQTIDRLFASTTSMALRLLPILGDLGQGFVNLVQALQRTGIVDQSVRGFDALSASFERATRSGGGLDTFLRASRQLMPFIAQAASDLTGAIFGIARAAIGARQEGSRLTVLQQIFRAISNAAGPLQRLVIGTFRELGPVIAQAIPVLTRFFGTFAGASGPLVTFTRTITQVLRLFNQLPPNIKQTIAQLVALRVILGGLGITALVAPLGRFAANMLLAAGAAGRIARPLEAAAGTAAAAGGRFGRLGAIVKTAGATLLGFARFAGPVAVVLGTIATAAVLVYRNWGRIKSIIQPVTEAFAGFIRQVRPAAQQLLPVLVKTLKSFASGLLSAVSPAKTLRGQVQDLVVRFARFVKDAGPPTVAALKAIKHWLEQNQPLIRTIGHVVGTVVVSAFKAFVVQMRAGITVLRVILQPLQHLRDLYESVAKALGNVAKKLDEVTPKWAQSGKNAALAFLNGFREGGVAGGVKNTVENAWEGLRKWQQEHSPAKRWMPQGKKAALGYAKGFESGSGEISKAAQRAASALSDALSSGGTIDASGRRAAQAATRRAVAASSPGGKNITKEEMRQIMKEAHIEGAKAQGKSIYAAAVAAGVDPRTLRTLWDLLDKSMGRDFSFRNNMGAAPN